MEYEKDYLKKNHDWHESDAIHKAEWIAPYIRGKNIAEIGCGSGKILNTLSTKYPDKNFTGYEISTTAYNLFLTNDMPNIQYRNVDFFIDNKSYDQILAIDIIEHLNDPFAFLMSLRNFANQFIFHIPLEFNFIYLLFNKHLDTHERYGHLHFYEKNYILAMLGKTGYSLDFWEFTPIAFIKKEKNNKTKLLNSLRSILFKFNKELTVKLLGGYSLLCTCR
jgi:hypothetical protein